jgi:hypothetical protein
MPERFAIYFAPARDSALWRKAEAWLAEEELQPLTVSARRYGFHATMKAPMALKSGLGWTQLNAALEAFRLAVGPVEIGRVGANLLDGFLALTPTPQSQGLTDFAGKVVEAFEPYRAPLDPADRERRLKSPLTPRQIELLDRYGYHYVLDEFLFHMTLTDRLPLEQRETLQKRAADWFAAELANPIVLDRLVLFHEAAPGEPFRRLNGDFILKGPQ